ncbi:MAG: DUF58 domain-containing protein [Myxococcota bacterium]|nr:DUF58 domain-containing protein [Myxococcota bacterium]
MNIVRRLRRRDRRKLPRQLKTTREGKLLIAITLGLGFGAINSGNNLLYLILGMLLSLVVVSGVLSELTLRGIRVRRGSTGSPHAGRDVFISYQLVNEKRRSGSFSVEVEEAFDEATTAHQRPGYSLFLRAKERHDVAAKLRFPARGVYETPGIRVATRFPFSFFRKWREFDAPESFVVYPSIIEVQSPRLFNVESGVYESFQKVGRGGEYYGLREHRLEDDPRDIHWKTSAKLGRLVARDYDATADRRVWILVVNAAPREADTETLVHDGHVEEAISHAASLATVYNTAGWAVGLCTFDGRIPPATGSGQLIKIYDHLARIPVRRGPADFVFDVPAAQIGERVLVRSAESAAVAVRGTWDWVYEGLGATSNDGQGLAT